MDDIRVTQTKFAQKVGVSRQRINTLVKQGVLKVDEKKKLNLKESLKIYNKHKDPAREPQREANKKKRNNNSLFDNEFKPDISIADLSPQELLEYEKEKQKIIETKETIKEVSNNIELPLISNIDMRSLNDAKKVKEYYQGLLAQINYDKETNRLIEITKVEQEAFEVARNLRDTLLSLPSRIAPEVASMNNIADIIHIITNEIHYALETLSK